jgi:putative ABC transport system substrate-binding protein
MSRDRLKRLIFLFLLPACWSQDAAAESGGSVHLYFVPPVSTAYIEVRFREALRKGADAVYVDAAFPGIRENLLMIHGLAVRHRIPVMHTSRGGVESGGLVSYSSDPDGRGQRLASFVSRILKGALPGDLPMEQSDKFELTINLDAARAIGLTIPPDVMIEAIRVEGRGTTAPPSGAAGTRRGSL